MALLVSYSINPTHPFDTVAKLRDYVYFYLNILILFSPVFCVVPDDDFKVLIADLPAQYYYPSIWQMGLSLKVERASYPPKV